MTFVLRKKKKGKKVSILEVGLFLCGIYLLVSASLIGGILLMLAGVISVLSKKQESFTISENEIVWSGVFSKSYKWEEIDNLILKDGLLTIDLNNNKLIQAEIVYDEEESSFNNFCQKHLKKNVDNHTNAS